MSDFTAIGQLVNEARNLLDSIKGGAIRTMQTQFDALKQTITTDGAKVVSDVDSLGRNKLQQLDSELALVKQGVDIKALGGQGRYVTEITVNGDSDRFYPVVFRMPWGEESEIQIYRSHIWNSSKSDNPSDLNSNTPGGALVVLRGHATPWAGVPIYLRTLVNNQTYRQNVANIAYRAFVRFAKGDHPSGNDTSYSQKGTDYGDTYYSGFMLRGGKMKYLIISNHPITFKLKQDGELLTDNSGTESVNCKSYAVSVHERNVDIGDDYNNHSISYSAYKAPEASA